MKAEEVTTRVEKLLEELRMSRTEVANLRTKAAEYKALMIANKAFEVGTSQTIR